MEKIIDVSHLSKSYGATKAVDDISFEVRPNEIFGIIGPNGAGKTTCIECLEGLRAPDSGSIAILGLDPKKDENALRQLTGVQLQQSSLQERIKVWEALDLYSSFYQDPSDWRQLVQRLGLEDKLNSFFGKLSGGQKQRLFIALALLPNPRLVFLDELTTGLDPQARRAIWQLVEDVRAEGKTVVLTTHFMEEAERLCDRVMIMDAGKVVALDAPNKLIENLGGQDTVSFEITSDITPGLEQRLSTLGQVLRHNGQITLQRQQAGEREPLVAMAARVLAEEGAAYKSLQTRQPTLEDVFLKLTGKQIRE